MGKQTLENKVDEEISYLVDEILKKKGQAFDVMVSLVSTIFYCSANCKCCLFKQTST